MLLTLAHRCVAEGIAVSIFVTAGGLALAGLPEATRGFSAAVVFGTVIGLLVYALARTSGAHFNPAITIALAATGRHPPRDVPPYIAAQLAGATAGAALVATITNDAAALLTLPSVTLHAWQAILIEAFATGVLAFVIMHAADKRSPQGDVPAAPIGLAVLLGALFAGPFTGGSMNPARSLGPALIAATPTASWIYVVGPIVGALIGAFSHDLVTGRTRPTRNARPQPAANLLPEDTP